MSVVFTGVGMEPTPISFVGMYSDGTPMVKTDQWGAIVEHADTMILRADSLHEFTTAMYLVDAISERGGFIRNLVLPYLPGARQDRSNPTGDVLFTAKSVAEDINRRYFAKVISVDPHSPVMPSLIMNFVEYPLEEIAGMLWHGYTGIIAPDKGAKDRAQRVALAMGLPVYYGSKVRDVSTGALAGFEVEELPKGGHFLVVDDICDGGGTFIGLGEKIREQGCFADLYVTHGIFSKGSRALRETFKSIYTTDTRLSWYGQPDGRTSGITRINVVEFMSNY